MKVAIAGGGIVGHHLARQLVTGGSTVTVFESNPAVAKRITMPEIEVIVADACEVSTLTDARLETFDAMVAATGDDEDNLVISLLSKQEFAVPRVLARVNSPDNEWLFNESWGVDVPLSVPQLVSALVEQEFTTGRLVRLIQLRETARLVEVSLAADSSLIGKALAEVDVPRGATVVAVLRGRSVVIPRGDTVFREGDEVVALVTNEAEDELKALLTGS